MGKNTEKIRVLVVKPMEIPFEAEVGNDLKSMQECVGGLIEVVKTDETSLFVCNEEGKLEGLQGNRRISDRDIIAGTFFICSAGEDGEFSSLNDEQMERYVERFKEPEFYTEEEVEDSIFIEFYDGENNNDFYGKIDFYSLKGEVIESLYYKDKSAFDKEIKDSCEIGRPINPQIISGDAYLENDFDEEMEL